MYYANAHIRSAVAAVLELPIEQVELGHDGTGWLILQPVGANPDPAAVAAWAPPADPPPPPVTDVEIMAPVFTNTREGASVYLDQLKAKVWDQLVNVQKMEPNDATAAGVQFNLSNAVGVGVAYDDFVKNGGHPLAAKALWDRIQEVKNNYPWLTKEVEAIFSLALIGP